MMKRILISSILFAITSISAQGAIVQTASYNGSTYYLLSVSTWSEAQTEAASLGGNLVTINNAAEDQWIWDTFSASAKGMIGDASDPYPNRLHSMWIGYNDLDNDNIWSWISGETGSYTNWAPTQPTNGTNENLAGISLGPWGEGQWHDIVYPSDTYDVGYGLVEVSAVPLPAAVWLFGTGLLGLLGWGRRKDHRFRTA